MNLANIYSLANQLKQHANGAGNPFYNAQGQFNMNQGTQSLIGAGYGAGEYDPSGQGAYLDALRRYLSGVGAGQIRQAQLGAQLYSPNDPMMENYARMNAEQSANSNLYNTLASAQAGAASQNRDFYHQLYLQYLQPTLRRNPRQPGSVSLGPVGASAGSNG